jgi:hypothetical protein
LLLSARLYSEWVWLASREREKKRKIPSSFVVRRPLRWIFIRFLFFLWRWHTTTYSFKCRVSFLRVITRPIRKTKKTKKLDRKNSCLTFIFFGVEMWVSPRHIQILIQNCFISCNDIIGIRSTIQTNQKFHFCCCCCIKCLKNFRKFNLISIYPELYIYVLGYLHKSFARCMTLKIG